MKTIQQVLREMDAEAIERAFFEEHPINIFDVEGYDEELTIGAYKNKVEKEFHSYLERLKSMETESGDRQGILFVYKSQKDSGMFLGKDVGLIYEDELVSADDLSDVPLYAYEYTDQKESLGFLVADNELTQQFLMDVIVSFLFEMSWFGYEQEGLQKEKDELDGIIKDFKEHPARSETVDLDELSRECGLPVEEVYPEEKEKERKWFDAGMDYTSYCRNIELERLKITLIGKRSTTGNQ